jgi:hypothetical protein
MMMLPVTPSTTHCQSNDESGFETSLPKTSAATLGSVVEISPEIGVEGHDQQGGDKAHPADDFPPPLRTRRHLLEGGDGVCTRRAPQHGFDDHYRQTDQQRGQQIDQQEAGAAVHAGQRREFPDVAEAHGRAQCGEEYAKGAGKSVALGWRHVVSGKSCFWWRAR